MLKKQLFPSFFWGGFECTYSKVQNERRIDMLAASKHDIYCKEDYGLLKQMGITTVREGLSWHQIDKGKGWYNFSRFEKMMRIGQKEGIKQIWDLNHFDYPEDLDPFSDEFVTRFADYSKACIKTIRKYQDGTIIVVPQNEISFFSYMSSDIGYWAPYRKQFALALKVQLVKASIAAMDEIISTDRDVKFMQVDPIFYRRLKEHPTARHKLMEETFKKVKFEAWDMLAGRNHPELGGDEKYMDIIGVNYYFNNQQWIVGHDIMAPASYPIIPWGHKKRIPLSAMIKEVYDRYRRPIAVTEVGTFGELREKWWKETLKEIDLTIKMSVPIVGVCAYPVIDYPEWTEGHFTHSGLWDFDNNDPRLERIPHQPSINIISNYIAKHNAKMANKKH